MSLLQSDDSQEVSFLSRKGAHTCFNKPGHPQKYAAAREYQSAAVIYMLATAALRLFLFLLKWECVALHSSVEVTSYLVQQ